jgi:hypothetical protein
LGGAKNGIALAQFARQLFAIIGNLSSHFSANSASRVSASAEPYITLPSMTIYTK